MIQPNYTPLEEVQKKYDFVKSHEAAESLINEKNNMGRYNYWLNTFYYSHAQGRVGCLLADMKKLTLELEKVGNAEKKRKEI